MIPPDYKALERELGPCALHDHFGQGECPDCEIRRKLADALSLAASLQDEKAEAETQRLREEHAHVREILQAGIDRDKGDESAVALAAIASNAIYWRDREIARLRAEKEQP